MKQKTTILQPKKYQVCNIKEYKCDICDYITSDASALPSGGDVLTVLNNTHDCSISYDINNWSITTPKITSKIK